MIEPINMDVLRTTFKDEFKLNISVAAYDDDGNAIRPNPKDDIYVSNISEFLLRWQEDRPTKRLVPVRIFALSHRQQMEIITVDYSDVVEEFLNKELHKHNAPFSIKVQQNNVGIYLYKIINKVSSNRSRLLKI